MEGVSELLGEYSLHEIYVLSPSSFCLMKILSPSSEASFIDTFLL
jgi:hypothetical protein